MTRTTPKDFKGFTELCTVTAQGMLEHRYGNLTVTSSTFVSGTTFSRRPVPVSELVRAVVNFTAEAVRQELTGEKAPQSPKGEQSGEQAGEVPAARRRRSDVEQG